MNINRFKATGDVRTWLNDLFDFSGYLSASDGHYLVIDLSTKSKFFGFPKFEDCVSKSDGKLRRCIHSIIEKEKEFNWRPMPSISNEDYRECDECDRSGQEFKRGDKCKECDGNGSVSFDNEYNVYEFDCKSCEGDGRAICGIQVCTNCRGTKKHLQHVPVVVDGLGNEKYCISAEFIEKFSELDNCQIAWVEDWSQYAVKFDGGVAIVFPMHR